MALSGSAEKALPLHDLKSVNTALSMLYDKDGNYRLGFSPDGFYKTQLLNTLEWGSENHVHQMYATSEVLKPGQKAVKYRRYRSLTPNLTPLPEGLPNNPDKLAYEEIEISNLFTFGRWYEFTAEVDWDVVDPVIARATQNLVDVAERTKELYARKTWLSSPNQYFANGKTFQTLTMADTIVLEDLLFITSRMERIQVKPLGGKFNYICSKEFIKGLIKDPIVKEYLAMNGVNPSEFLKALNGEPLDLIDVKFIPTMLDEYAYPDLEYPGVYYDASIGMEVIRYVADATTGPVGKKDGKIWYLDLPANFIVKSAGSVTVKNTASAVTYLQDGSAIDNKVTWLLPLDADAMVFGNFASTLTSAKALLREATITKGVHGDLTASTITEAHANFGIIDALIDAGKFTQLPVHRGVLFGDEALVKIVHANRNDSAELIIHKPGESGALDPYNQRQSISVRVKGFGVGINRTEAIVVTFGVPYLAANAFLTAMQMTWANGGLLDERGLGGFHAVSDTTGLDVLPVAGINMAALPNMSYPAWKASTSYVAGNMVTYKGGVYVFSTSYSGSTWDVTKVIKVNQAISTVNEPKAPTNEGQE
jgi:hypothetical protein